jgi:hypothetical protein
MFFGVSADPATLSGGRLINPFSTTGTAFLSPTGHFINCCPSAPFGFFCAQTPILIAFFDVFGLTLLLGE